MQNLASLELVALNSNLAGPEKLHTLFPEDPELTANFSYRPPFNIVQFSDILFIDHLEHVLSSCSWMLSVANQYTGLGSQGGQLFG